MRFGHVILFIGGGSLLPACDCGGPRVPPDVRFDSSVTDSNASTTSAVFINEVVITPRHDWSDAGGTPYDATPGTGLISIADQYVELINAGDVSVDLTDWTLRAIDDYVETATLDPDATIVFSPGSSLEGFEPGGIAVIGDPVGRMSTDIYLQLHDAVGFLADDVEIGGLTDDRDQERDGIDDGAPDAAANGFARGSYDESVARVYDPVVGPVDTDDDQHDFVALRATPGLPNRVVPPPVETIPPTVIEPVTGVAVGVEAGLWARFDEPVDHESVDADGAIAMTADGVPVALGLATFTDDDAVMVINPIGVLPFDTEVTVTIRGGSDGVGDLNGNPLAAGVVFTVHTESAPANPGGVLINEICSDPVQDWDDSAGGDQVAFSAVPGTGTANHDDEWVELVELSAGASDLTGYNLTLYRGFTLIADPRASTSLVTTTSVVRVVGAGSGVGDVHPGDRIVIGDPASSMGSSYWLGLRDGAGALVDFVEVGGNTAATDRGGDGINNGAPGAGEDGRALGLDSEVVARVPDGSDTGPEGSDFDHAVATLGAPN